MENQGIRNESYRSQSVTLSATSVQRVNFNDTRPNSIQIRNFTSDTIYIGLTQNVSASNYEISIVSDGTRVFAVPNGVTEFYIYSVASGTSKVNSVECWNMFSNEFDVTQTSVTVLTSAELKPVTTPTIENLAITEANTQYSYTIPENTRKLTFSLQDYDATAVVSYYFSNNATKVMKISGSAVVSLDDLKLNSKIIYFKSTVASKTMQIESWS